jgi:hypothetical protein
MISRWIILCDEKCFRQKLQTQSKHKNFIINRTLHGINVEKHGTTRQVTHDNIMVRRKYALFMPDWYGTNTHTHTKFNTHVFTIDSLRLISWNVSRQHWHKLRSCATCLSPKQGKFRLKLIIAKLQIKRITQYVIRNGTSHTVAKEFAKNYDLCYQICPEIRYPFWVTFACRAAICKTHFHTRVFK